MGFTNELKEIYIIWEENQVRNNLTNITYEKLDRHKKAKDDENKTNHQRHNKERQNYRCRVSHNIIKGKSNATDTRSQGMKER